MSTFTDKTQEFFDESNLSERTKTAYGYIFSRLDTWVDTNHLEVDTLDSKSIRRFLTDQGWGANLQRQSLAALRSYARSRGIEHHAVFKIKLPKDNAGPQRTPDADQIRLLLDSFNQATPAGIRDLAMCSLMLETGLRSAEICRLEVRYLDLEKRRLSVIAKGGKWRDGKFSAHTADLLARWLAARESIAKPGVKTVFVGIGGLRPGTPFTTGGMRANFRAIGKRAGLEGFSPHDLRRAMAVQFTERGLPSRMVQILGAWSDIRLVERYTRSINLGSIDIEAFSPVAGMS